ncbi:MAG: hypothetical protein ACK501_20725 [Planctomycetota bacterium]
MSDQVVADRRVRCGQVAASQSERHWTMEALERDVGEHLRQCGSGHGFAHESLGDMAGQQRLDLAFRMVEQALRVRDARRLPAKGKAMPLHDALLPGE